MSQPINSYLIVDPNHPYAVHFMERALALYGMRPVVLFRNEETDIHSRDAVAPWRKQIGPHRIFYLNQTPLLAIRQQLQGSIHIQGYVPHNEIAMDLAAEIVDVFHLPWNNPEVIRLFRHKYALKAYLQQKAPHIPLGACYALDRAEQIDGLVLPKKFVIKPNGGYANRNVGFFDQRTSKDELRAFVGAIGSSILEEFLEGPEYAANGMIDEQGHVAIYQMIQYERRPANGKPNLYYRNIQIPTTHLAYESVANYVTKLLQATTLVRCPFHVEVIDTANGPRLIEVGARVIGSSIAPIIDLAQGHGFHYFDRALHGYLFQTPYVGPAANMSHYDQTQFIELDGCLTAPTLIYNLAGFEEVAKWPEFLQYNRLPKVGQLLPKTTDMLSTPYAAQFFTKDPNVDLRQRTSLAELVLQINPKPKIHQLFRAPVQYMQHKGQEQWKKVKYKVACYLQVPFF